MAKKTQASKVPGELLFVNKNASSRSFSHAASREEAAAINSYAQKFYLENNASKVRSTQSAVPAPGTDGSRSFKSYVTKTRVSLFSDVGSKPKRRRRPPAKTKKKDKNKELDLDLDLNVDEEIRHDLQRQVVVSRSEGAYSLPTPSETEKSESLSPPRTSISQVSGSSIDPFSITSLPLDTAVAPVLQYYINFTLLSTFNAHSTAAVSTAQLAHHAAIKSIVAGCLENSTHMYALLSATASRMRAVSQVPLTGTRSPEFFLGKAIGSVRHSLSTPTVLSDKQTILNIFYLSVCEWYMHSYDAARTHFGFLRHFWKTIDPKNSVLEKYMHDMISYNDVFLAIETGQRPLLEVKWEPRPLSEEEMLSVKRTAPGYKVYGRGSLGTNGDLVAFGSAFNSTNLPTALSHELRDVIESMPDLMHVYHYTLINSSVGGEVATYLSSKSQSLLYRLTNLSSHGYERCISLSLTILLCCMSTSAAWRAGKVNLARVAKNLGMQLQYEIYSHPGPLQRMEMKQPVWTGGSGKLLLWVLVTGLFAAAQGPEKQWFASKTASLTAALRMDLDDLEALMHSFVYLPSLQQKGLEDWYRDKFG